MPAFAGDVTDSSGETSNLKSSSSGTHRKESAVAAMASNLKSASSSGVAKNVVEMETPRQPPSPARPKTPLAAKTAAARTAKTGSPGVAVATKVAGKGIVFKPKDTGGIVGIVRRHPTTSIVIGVLAAFLAIAVGVILMRPGQTASAKDHSQATSQAPRTTQSEMAASK